MKIKAINKKTGLINFVDFKTYDDFGNIKTYLSYLRAVFERNPAFISLFIEEQKNHYINLRRDLSSLSFEYKTLIQKEEVETVILETLLKYYENHKTCS